MTVVIVFIGLIILTVLIFCMSMQNEYNGAASQKKFYVIEDEEASYIVISQSKERFSAYKYDEKVKISTNKQGVIQSDSYPFIYKDVHRYFKCEEVVTKRKTFSNIAYWDKD